MVQNNKFTLQFVGSFNPLVYEKNHKQNYFINGRNNKIIENPLLLVETLIQLIRLVIEISYTLPFRSPIGS